LKVNEILRHNYQEERVFRKREKSLRKKWVNIGQIIDNVKKAQRLGYPWNDGLKLEDEDMD